MRLLTAMAALGTFGTIAAGATKVVDLRHGKQIHFLGRKDGQKAIIEDVKDPFFRSLSVVDAELRLAEPLPDSTPQHRLMLLKKLFSDSVMEWNDAEIEAITQACRYVLNESARWSTDFVPDQWRFVKTDGSEEAQAAYTRHDVIVLPPGKLNPVVNQPAPSARKRLARLVAHETSHVYSRLNPKQRDRLYERLGFEYVGPVRLGGFLEKRRITNPDGTLLAHVVRVRRPERGEFPAVLVMYSKSPRFDPLQGRRLFDYLQWKLFAVQKSGGGYEVERDAAGNPVGYSPMQVTGFFEKVGRNTRYIVHPDEILADNIALLLTGNHPGGPASPVANPKLLRDLGEILRGTVLD